MMNKYVQIISMCIWFFYFGSAYAQDNYRTEMSVNYDSSKDDDIEVKIYGIMAGIHFSPVDTTGHPLAEADFLERVGGIALTVGKMEAKSGSTSVDADGPFYGLLVALMKPDYPLTANVMYFKTETEFAAPYDGEITVDSYGFNIGKFISDGLLAFVGYSHTESDISFAGLLESKRKTNDYSTGVKYVNELHDNAAFNIEADLAISQFDGGDDDGSNTIFGLSGDYYFTNRTSLGAGFDINIGDDKSDEGISFGINSTVFITPHFLLSVGFEKFQADNDEGEDEDSYDVTMSARF